MSKTTKEELAQHVAPSRAQQQYGKAKDQYHEAVAQRVNIGNTNERKQYSSIAETWDVDPISTEKVSVKEDTPEHFVEVWDRIATTHTNTDPQDQRTEAEREAL